MKQSLFILFCIGIVSFSSCSKSTDSDEYNSIWKAYSETNWVRSGSATEGFKATNSGFTFIANIADTGTYTYTFVPSIYIVSNITTARNAVLSFRGAVIDGPDTVLLSAGGSQLYSFGLLSGTVQTMGTDSIPTAPRSYAGGVSTSMGLSVNPDSCSRQVKFNVTVSWNPFTGGATVNPLPKQKKVAVEFFDIEMRVNGIKILSEK